MQQFEWHDGSVKNVHVDIAMLFEYQVFYTILCSLRSFLYLVIINTACSYHLHPKLALNFDQQTSFQTLNAFLDKYR